MQTLSSTRSTRRLRLQRAVWVHGEATVRTSTLAAGSSACGEDRSERCDGLQQEARTHEQAARVAGDTREGAAGGCEASSEQRWGGRAMKPSREHGEARGSSVRFGDEGRGGQCEVDIVNIPS
ncbi:hypothetical protein GW17_00000336 [Ensete ventricosum]|nr:hypothetical protein GW17_00000336 [Ensete ventricosum]RZR79931.1 hypothetical protein BHM03_00005809 [Ensete ventricosum]